ncbi:Ig-like domain-containing protein [Caballeronia sordidicola]|uniref:Ig-like domain-containing protein n=1 Tax=Caballeronia sordidicola TaxID=196367 RepID=UPI00068A27A7|nr:Ig-like domain-containing protein [Caballeronia sordidicola]
MPSDFNVRVQAVITDVQGVTNGGTITSEKPLIAGKADPFATIDVYDGTTLLGVVAANGQGGWSLQLSTPLFDGIHDLSAVQLNEFGVGPSTSYFAITVDTSESEQVAQNNDSLFERTPRVLDNQTGSDLPYFPPNLFKLHSASSNANTDGIVADKTAHGLVDSTGDPLPYVRQSSAPLESGKGFDMISFLGDHQVLNLNNFTEHSAAAAQTQSVVGFDLGGHHNALKVSLADVLSLGEQDLFIDDGKQQLIVNGKEGDSVDLTSSHVAGLAEGDWHHHGTAEVGGVLYNVVEHSTANTELLVEHSVRIEMH